MKPRIIPLRWVEHHVRNNGWFGYTATGAEIVYVFQPYVHRGPRRWYIWQYWGSNKDRCGDFGKISDPKTGKVIACRTAREAKRKAQAYWRREVHALLAPIGFGVKEGR